jgi:hypothetical protein
MRRSPRGSFGRQHPRSVASVPRRVRTEERRDAPARAAASRRPVYVREEHGPISTFTGDGTFLHRIDNRDGARDLVVRPDGSIVATCDRCYQLLELSTLDARVIARHDVPMLDGDGIGPTSSDASGDIAIELYASETILVFDRQLSVLGGMRLPEGSPGATLGHVADYGAWYWPVPLFLPDGRAITFDREGLVVMKVDLTR